MRIRDINAENFEGYFAIVLLAITVPVVKGSMREVVNLILNHRDYGSAFLMLTIVLVNLLVGVMAFGYLKRQFEMNRKSEKSEA